MSRFMLTIVVFTFLINNSSAFSETYSEQVPVIFNGEEMLVGGFVIDKDDNIYLTQGRNGVLRRKPNSVNWEQVISTYTHSISLGPDDALWAIRSTGTLVKYKENTVTNYINNEFENITSITVLPGNVVWGTGRTVLRYELEDDLFTFYGEEDGLPSIGGKWIVSSSDGHIWVSHTDWSWCEDCQYGGVSHFNGTSWEVFTVENGLLDKVVKSIVAISSSEVYIAGPGGIAKYNGETLEPFCTDYDIQFLSIGPDNSLWATGYRISSSSFVHVNFNGNRIYEYEYDRSGTPSSAVRMSIDSRGVIWESMNGRFYKHVLTDYPNNVETLPEEQLLSAVATPNPFNPVTSIAINLPEESEIRLDVFDITGRHIETLANARYSSGHHTIQWNGSRSASGIYLCRLAVGSKTVVIKLCLLR